MNNTTIIEKALCLAVEDRAFELRRFPNPCAYTDCIQTELNALVLYARKKYGKAAYDFLSAPKFDRFNTQEEAEELSENTAYINNMVDKYRKGAS